jgi:hypothetical protein
LHDSSDGGKDAGAGHAALHRRPCLKHRGLQGPRPGARLGGARRSVVISEVCANPTAGRGRSGYAAESNACNFMRLCCKWRMQLHPRRIPGGMQVHPDQTTPQVAAWFSNMLDMWTFIRVVRAGLHRTKNRPTVAASFSLISPASLSCQPEASAPRRSGAYLPTLRRPRASGSTCSA